MESPPTQNIYVHYIYIVLYNNKYINLKINVFFLTFYDDTLRYMNAFDIRMAGVDYRQIVTCLPNAEIVVILTIHGQAE